MSDHANIRRARHLRQTGNAPEQKAWAALRTLRGEGFPVRRQHPIDLYTVDFAVLKARLVIEIDGGVHGLEAVERADAERDARLKALGWRVVRIPAEIAMSADHLLDRVRSELGL